MMISMRLLEDDIESVREAMDYWKDVVDIILSPCTQLVEFTGCVGIIEGMIVTCQDDVDKNIPRLEKALESFESFAATYPIFNCRLNYLRGKADQMKKKINGETDMDSTVSFFRQAVSWARRFELPHEENLVRNIPEKDLVDITFAVEIMPKEFIRSDCALDGIVGEEVLKDFRKVLEEVGEKEEHKAWMRHADRAASWLESIWGSTSEELLSAVAYVRSDLLKETLTTYSSRKNSTKEVPLDKASGLAKERLTVLAYCIASYRSSKAKEAAAKSESHSDENYTNTD